MTTAQLFDHEMTPARSEGWRRLRFTPAQYWHLHELGVLPKLSELVDGEIFFAPARFWPAAQAGSTIAHALGERWHSQDLVALNGTHVFPSGWLPMPDVAVYDALPPRRPDEGVAYPPPRLIVEVADETLAYDLGEKAERYAREGVPELWVGDVNRRRLHVLREPLPDGTWRTRRALDAAERFAPLCLPDARLAVGDLLPELDGRLG